MWKINITYWKARSQKNFEVQLVYKIFRYHENAEHKTKHQKGGLKKKPEKQIANPTLQLEYSK